MLIIFIRIGFAACVLLAGIVACITFAMRGEWGKVFLAVLAVNVAIALFGPTQAEIDTFNEFTRQDEN